MAPIHLSLGLFIATACISIGHGLNITKVKMRSTTTTTTEYPITEDQIKDDVQPTPKFQLNVGALKTEAPPTTRRPERKKERPEKTTTTTTTEKPTETFLYRFNNEDGGACILLEVDADITFKYQTTDKVEEESSLYLPEMVSIDGDCSNEDEAKLVLRWDTFVFSFYFAKTPGGEHWFVGTMELRFNTSDRHFKRIKIPPRTVLLSTPRSHSSLLFPTPVGKSFTCNHDIEVALSSESQKDISASVLLRAFRIQPFIFKNDEFGPPHQCPAIGAGTYRSETAPLVVGSLLAGTTLCTIAGYSIYRYFVIKKVEYDTME
ncbi:unnamed protein product [Bemisia tabaci]|uniref:Lysosome-associated membrane glycoprotein 2-like luminal domain-containing protein n=1 Tax=Bemisia tabaci TaxID=7038 RepID=A0A9N9ZZR7_BEMTA|nr:PREDICTED: uncharacterized protein LOC109041171 [Bemisia tabaci]CAH0381040.1 unnamed protein product [Bemisia tabaci]